MINNNKMMIDRPTWEQLSFCPTSGAAGTNICDDSRRFIYSYIQISTSAAHFWRYDTWFDTWQQMATPPTQTGSVSNMVYNRAEGGQWAGKIYGSIYLFVSSSTSYLYKFNIATNTWSAALNTTGIPTTFGTDCYLMHIGVSRNNFEGGYHSGTLRTITSTAAAVQNATTLSVAALPEALAVGALLRFGKYDITVTSNSGKGATSISVSGNTQALAKDTTLWCSNGYEVTLSSDCAANATTLPVYPLQFALDTTIKINVEMYACVSAAAIVGATSLSVVALRTSIPSTSNALYYGNLFLIGNNSTVMYRYNIGTNTWSTTSSNTGNPALAAIPAAVGAGCALKWLPSYDTNKLWCLRGAGTPSVFIYDLNTNTWTTETYYPSSETFSTGTSVAARDVVGKQNTLVIAKDASMRIFQFDVGKHSLEPLCTQWIYPTGTAVIGDKSCIVSSPDGVDFYYMLLHSSNAFVRCALIDT